MSVTKREFQKAIDQHFNTRWQPDDFYVAYVWEHREELGEDNYYNLSRRKQKAVRDKVNALVFDPEELRGLRESVVEDVNERLVYFLREVCE